MCALLEWAAVLQVWSNQRELLIPRSLGWLTTAIALVPLSLLPLWALPAGRTAVSIYMLLMLTSIALALLCLIWARAGSVRSRGVQIGSILLLLLDGVQLAVSSGLWR
jgi:hypothetical protein